MLGETASSALPKNATSTTRLGGKIRRLRRRTGWTQARLANQLDISASYLNLIEHNRRNVTVPLLLRIAELFQVEVGDLVEDDEGQLVADLMDLFADDIFDDHDLRSTDVRDLIGAAPGVGRAILSLYDAFKKSREDLQSFAEDFAPADELPVAVQTDRFPAEQVSDFLQANGNYLPDLEAAAVRVNRDLRQTGADPFQAMSAFLANAYGIRIVMLPPDDGTAALRRFNPDTLTLEVSELLPPASRNFQLACQIGLLAAKVEIDSVLGRATLAGPDAPRLARVAMANYFAAALLMPYEAFLEHAIKFRYDIDLLAHHFDTSFEQVCHRLMTLQRPGARGIPFHMLRTDIAGNISKRFSLSGIHIPRHGGACPRWNVYTAFMHPGTINVQVSRMTDGRTYFCIARAYKKSIGGYDSPPTYLSIGLGCDIQHANGMVYADGIDLSKADQAVPVGVSCRTCERMDCRQRAFPPVSRPLNIDENVRAPSAYVPAE